MTFPGLVFLIGGDASPLGLVLLPPGGTIVALTVPPGLTGSSCMLQGAIVAPTLAVNGLYAATDAHEIRIL